MANFQKRKFNRKSALFLFSLTLILSMLMSSAGSVLAKDETTFTPSETPITIASIVSGETPIQSATLTETASPITQPTLVESSTPSENPTIISTSATTIPPSGFEITPEQTVFEIDKNDYPISDSLVDSIIQILPDLSVDTGYATKFGVIYYEEREYWAWINLVVEDGTLFDDYQVGPSFLIFGVKREGSWEVAYTKNDDEYSYLLNSIDRELLSLEDENLLSSYYFLNHSNSEVTSLSGNLLYPWGADQNSWKLVQGFHSSGNSYLGEESGAFALDFQPPSEANPAKALAMESGTVTNMRVCTYNTVLAIRFDGYADSKIFIYLHLQNGTVPVGIGSRVSQGQYLGDLRVPVINSTNCNGYSSCERDVYAPTGGLCSISTGRHLHLGIGTDQSIVINGKAANSISVGNSLNSTNGSGGGGSCSTAPSLSSPTDGYTSGNQNITFSWSAVSGCTSGYTFRIKDTSNMDSGGNTIVDTGEGGTSRSETIGTQWNNKDLYWGVKTATGSNWSVRRFRIEPGSTGSCSAPSLSSPSDGYISSSQSVNFSWSTISGCTYNGYTFRIKNASNMESGGTTIVDTGIGGTSTSQTIGSQWNNQDLYWGVKAANAPNGSNWSVRKFRIEPGSGSTCPSVSGEIRLYDSPNCSGSSVAFSGTGLADFSSSFNDKAESIAIPGGWSVKAYVDNSESSDYKCFTSTDTNLNDDTFSGGSNVANQITWVRVYNNSSCLTATDGASFISQSVYPTVNPGQSFQVFFQVQNSGTSSWDSGSYWLQNLQNSLGANSVQSLSQSVAPGGTFTWTINMTAPTTPGVYRSQWMISHNGTVFGPNMFLDVSVQSSIPTTPANLQIASGSPTSIVLTWADVTNEDGYKIYRWDGATASFVYLDSLGANQTSYTETRASCGWDQYYEVSAYNSYGESALTGWVHGSTQSCPPVNDLIKNAQVISVFPYSFTEDLNGTTASSSDPSPSCIGNHALSNTIWFKYSPDTTRVVNLTTGIPNSTVPGSYDSVIGVYKGTSTSLTEVACNDDVLGGDIRHSSAIFTANAGTTYYIMVANWYSTSVNAATELTLSLITPLDAPSIKSPEDGLNTKETLPIFDWSTVTDGNTYEIQISNDPSLVSPMVDRIGSSGSHSFNSYTFSDGSYYWRVRGLDTNNVPGQWSKTFSLVIDNGAPLAPVLNSPSDNMVLRGPQQKFTWLASSSATQYLIEYDNDSNFSSPMFTSGALTSTSIDFSNLVVGNYYWHVKAGDAAGNWSDWSDFRKVTILPFVPGAPVLVSPVSGFMTNDPTPSLNWNSVASADHYEIQISKSSTYTTWEQLSSVDSGEVIYNANALLDGKHYWRVRAINVNGEAGSWSSSRYFTIDTISQAIPSMSSPANGSTVFTTIPKLVVGSVSGAKYYQFQVDDSDDFLTPLVNVLKTTPYYTLLSSQALPFGTMYWRVQSIDSAGNSSGWTSVRTFNVNILKAPTNLSYTTSQKPTFSWSTAKGALEYRIQVAVDELFENLVIDLNRSPSTSYIPTTGLDFGVYHWRMQVRTSSGWGNWTPTFSFKVTPALPVAPVLVSPVNALLTNENTPNFSWNSVTNGVKFEIQISKSSSFSTSEQDTILEPGIYSYTANMLSDGRHYWRVRAINFLNIPGKWSTYRYFTVDTLAPSVPAMSTPAGSVVVHTTTPKLVVYTVSGAKYYRFQVDDMNDFYSPLVDVTKTLNYYTVQSSLALPYGAMYWRVQTIDAAGNASAWSSPKSFIVSP